VFAKCNSFETDDDGFIFEIIEVMMEVMMVMVMIEKVMVMIEMVMVMIEMVIDKMVMETIDKMVIDEMMNNNMITLERALSVILHHSQQSIFPTL
jgi:hypothetical protein